MSLLLYCIAKPSALQNESRPGVAGTPVSRVEGSNLAAFVSRDDHREVWLQAPVSTSALEFHHVLTGLFKSAAIIPFRFPTILENDHELAELLNQRSSEYNMLLSKFENWTQMEARVTYSTPGGSAPTGSGREYLLERQRRQRALADFGSELGTVVFSVAEEWRQRSMKSGLRCFGLVERNRIADFKERMRSISVPAGLKVRVSGPWPVTEFLDLN
jgi:hypothetical protein